MKKICCLVMALSTTIPALAAADGLSGGIVVCYSQGNTLESARRIIGNSFVATDLATQVLRHPISPTVVEMAGAEVPVAIQVGVADGYAFYDRDVVIGADRDLGVSGQRIVAWLGASIESCRLVVEMETCPRADNPDWTVSCSDPRASEAEGQEGANF